MADLSLFLRGYFLGIRILSRSYFIFLSLFFPSYSRIENSELMTTIPSGIVVAMTTQLFSNIIRKKELFHSMTFCPPFSLWFYLGFSTFLW